MSKLLIFCFLLNGCATYEPPILIPTSGETVSTVDALDIHFKLTEIIVKTTYRGEWWVMDTKKDVT